MKLAVRTLVKIAISPAIVVAFAISLCLWAFACLVNLAANSVAWTFDLEKVDYPDYDMFQPGFYLFHFLISDFVPKKYDSYEDYLDSLPKGSSIKGKN